MDAVATIGGWLSQGKVRNMFIFPLCWYNDSTKATEKKVTLVPLNIRKAILVPRFATISFDRIVCIKIIALSHKMPQISIIQDTQQKLQGAPSPNFALFLPLWKS